ncbi:four-carbon acid sugar kinase family protein [Thermoflavimicrobium dichotomicum]|uniref:Uncharacterized conserved protein YgbK, DUF1537 family n=1 Tax=Thermoflavimicrobium dichotomicum TaxID=46223 RepID=A0A1I3V1T3_9BACL|nr:four-carbon acid sugar kinase family protein [Thermoflavimicrobium dichotomicum]SFJ88893.1 Uncharacterized conserved protein YgbK, DUF1537 family [Thermoflavimicrobium dichotomicum]
MRKLLVIADDITGSNATGVLFQQIGWKVRTIPDYRTGAIDVLEQSDVVVWNSRSRLLPPSQAKSRIQQMMASIVSKEEIKKHVFVSKRIDSTFRGPIGAEIEGILACFSSDYKIVIVPAYPSSGRITKGGHLYVHGIPVHLTEAGKDPFTPVSSSHVVEILKSQTSFPIGWIETEKYAGQELVKRIQQVASRNRIIICDAASEEEIQRLARAWIQSDLPIIPVDPGPFTFYYVSSQLARQKQVLMVCGSLAQTSREQVDTLEEQGSVGMIRLDIGLLSDPEHSSHYQARIIGKVAELRKQYQVIGIRTDGDHHQHVDGKAASEAISNLVQALLSQYHFSGLYLSGGEVAFATLSKMKVESLQLISEIVPLCVMAKAVGGPYEGISIVTKGGSVGDRLAIVKSIQHLLYAR